MNRLQKIGGNLAILEQDENELRILTKQNREGKEINKIQLAKWLEEIYRVTSEAKDSMFVKSHERY